MLSVRDAQGREVAGRIEVTQQERRWAFVPERGWLPGGYTVAVDGRLEDLAGNTPLRVFDRDLRQQEPPVAALSVPFTVLPRQ
jgi:hypothetical protein